MREDSWARVVVMFVLVMGSGASSSAQSAAPTPLPTVFVGAGWGPATKDAGSRMRLYNDEFAYAWLLEGGAALSRRVGIGVELTIPSRATGDTLVGLGRTQIVGRQDERVVVGVLRGRVFTRGVVALDVVGGGGVLFQRHQQGACTPVVPRCDDTSGPDLNERAPVFVAGADIPVQVARHFVVAVQPRLYMLQRGENVSQNPVFLPWQFEFRSSRRVSVGAAARLVW